MAHVVDPKGVEGWNGSGSVEFYLYLTVSTALIHVVKPESTR